MLVVATLNSANEAASNVRSNVGEPTEKLVAAAPAVESSVFREHSYCVLLANLFCHAGKAFVPAKKFVKIGAGGGGSHGV